MEIINTDAVLKIPADVAVCPKCGGLNYERIEQRRMMTPAISYGN